MNFSPKDASSLARDGMQALRSGDARLARESFDAIVSLGVDDASSCTGLAIACRRLEDGPASLAAIDRALAHEPRNLRALIVKGDLLDWLGDPRGASSHYMAAVTLARSAGQVPADLHPDLARAQAQCERIAGQIEERVRSRLAAQGMVEGRSGGRFLQSLDILFGRKRAYFQQPRYYYFPGLANIPFFDRADFPWLDQVEAATGEIRAELLEIMRQESAFKPYVQGDPRRPRKEQDGMLDNPDWSAFYLWKNGTAVGEHTVRAPATMAALAGAPLTQMANRSPSILFSQLRAGAHIPPHCGLVNSRLICHLPLIVPGKCAFRVGNEIREWEEGKAWVFDDSIEHEAWNRSEATRVILLFEIWRPELSTEERAFVTAMFEAIDACGGERPDWEI